MICPGNAPPKNRSFSQVPTTGMPSRMPSKMRSPVPESMSSGRAYPLHPPASAVIKIRNSSTQPARRGLRNAPVKNVTRSCPIEGRGQQQCGPVMGLPKEQPARNLERDVQRRRERLRHLLAVQGRNPSVVHDRRTRWGEEEHQDHAGHDDDHHAGERDHPEHVRPVHGHRAMAQVLQHSQPPPAERRACEVAGEPTREVGAWHPLDRHLVSFLLLPIRRRSAPICDRWRSASGSAAASWIELREPSELRRQSGRTG